MKVNTIGFEWKLDYFELCRVFLYDYDEVEEVNFTRSSDTFYIEIVSSEVTLNSISIDSNIFTDNFKNQNKHLIYKLLNKITNKELPWGILTGIRPLKLIRNLLGKFKSDEVKRLLQEEYLIENNTIDLALEIILRQEPFINDLNDDSYSLYIDIPFCPTKCIYCSYKTFLPNGDTAKKYVEALLNELAYFASKVNQTPDTIYIGGGTPSAIPLKELEKIISFVVKHFGTSREFTVEVGRPDTISRELLDMLNSYGVHRISINPQSLNDKTLVTIGRSHSVEDIIKAYRLAREYDFLINMDLILGLPGESKVELSETLKIIRKLQPDNLTIHSLALKKGSKLIEGGTNPYGDYEEMYKLSREFTLEEGYKPYYLYRQKRIAGNGENIGYAKEGYESLYNIYMMEDVQDILGIGLSSITKIKSGYKLYRHFNPKDLSNYMEAEYLEKKYDFIKNINEKF